MPNGGSRGSRVDVDVLEDASDRDLPDATSPIFFSVCPLGVRRRHAPENFREKKYTRRCGHTYSRLAATPAAREDAGSGASGW